jgi:hypothetical protein
MVAIMLYSICTIVTLSLPGTRASIDHVWSPWGMVCYTQSVTNIDQHPISYTISTPSPIFNLITQTLLLKSWTYPTT